MFFHCFYLGTKKFIPQIPQLLGYTALEQYSNVAKICWMQVSIILVSGVMFTFCMSFIVLPHIWFVPIYAVNVVADVMVCVDIYVVLLTHILSWIYPLFLSVNPTSV